MAAEAVESYENRVVCLNSATAAEELNLRILGVGPGDEVLIPAYTYTASASAAIHCGATVKFVDIQKDGDPVTHAPEMDYSALEAAITEKTKAVIVVDLGGIVCDYERVFEIIERKRALFTPMESDGTPLGDLSSRVQKALGRVAVVADCEQIAKIARDCKRYRLKFFCRAVLFDVTLNRLSEADCDFLRCVGCDSLRRVGHKRIWQSDAQYLFGERFRREDFRVGYDG